MATRSGRATSARVRIADGPAGREAIMRWVQLFLLCLAFAIIEALIGGTRLLFSLPSCAVLALMALLSPLSWRHPDRPAHAGCLIATGVFAGLICLRAWFS